MIIAFRLAIQISLSLVLCSCGYIIEQVSNLSSRGGSPPVLSNMGEPGKIIYISTTSFPLSWFPLDGDVTYTVEKYSGPFCQGQTISEKELRESSYTLTQLQNGETYSVRMRARNSWGISNAVCSPAIAVDTQKPNTPTFVNPSAATFVGTLSYQFSWNTSDLGISGLRSSEAYQVETFSNGNCTGQPATSTLTDTASASVLSLSDLSSYSVRVRAFDNAGNESTAVCSSSVTVNLGIPTLSLQDAVTSSTTFAKQTNLTALIQNDVGATKWCLSETQTTAPASGAASCIGGAGPSSGWYTVRPTTFVVGGSDGTKTVHLWVVLGSGSVLPIPTSQSIVLDQTLPVAPVFTAPLAAITTYSTSIAAAWTASDATSGLATPSTYQVDLYTNGNCSGVSTSTTTQSTPNIIINSIAPGTVSMSVSAFDRAGNSASTCSVGIVIAAPTIGFTISESTALSGYARQTLTQVAITSDTGATRWCLSELQTVAPIDGMTSCVGGGGPSNGWSTSRPTSFNLTTGDGSKTVYLWVADSANLVYAVANSKTIYLDTVAPSLTSITLNSGLASAATNNFAVTIIAADPQSGLATVRFSESSTFVSNSWQPYASPTTYTAPPSQGLRTYYSWVRDAAGNISPMATDSITIIRDPPLANFVLPNGTLTWTTGQTVNVSWTASTSATFHATEAVGLEYTLNNGATTTSLTTGLINGPNGGCVIAGAETGCTTFLLPAPLNGLSFRLVLSVKDVNENLTKALSPVLNLDGLVHFAGLKADSLGGNAGAIQLSSLGKLAIDTNGDLYISRNCAIQKMSGDLGVLTPYIGNGTCGNSGNGSAPSTTTLINAPQDMKFDNDGNLHWIDGWSVRRVNKMTGLVELVAGGGAAVNPTTGLSKTGFSKYIGGIDFDSLNRLHMIVNVGGPAVGTFNAVVVRVNTDNLLEVIAENYTNTSPVDGTDARTTGIVGDYWQIGNVAIAIKRSSTDTIYFQGGDLKIYRMLATDKLAYNLNTRAISGQLIYSAARDRLIAGDAGSVKIIHPTTLNSSSSLSSTDYVFGMTSDQNGGIYFVHNSYQTIRYASITNALSTFAGIVPGSGDTGPAVLADIRKPSRVLTATDGTVFFHDGANLKYRKVDTSSNMQLVRGGLNGNDDWGRLALLGGNTPIFSSQTWAFGDRIYNLATAACTYLCAGGGNPTLDTASNGTLASTIMNTTSLEALAYDPVRNSVFVSAANNGAYVNEIDSTGAVTRVVGQNGVNTDTTVGTATSAATLVNLNGTSGIYHNVLQAYNGTLYRDRDGTILAYPIGGNVSSVASGTRGFYVDGPNNRIYVLSTANILYHKPLIGGSLTAIKTFPVTMTLHWKGPSSNSLLLTSGNSIYQYIDPVNIP